MALLLLLNTGLFVVVAAAGAVVFWIGWKIAGADDDSGPSGDGGGAAGWRVPPLPGGSVRPSGPDDLARST